MKTIKMKQVRCHLDISILCHVHCHCLTNLRPAFTFTSVLAFRRGVSQVHYKRTEGSL